MLNQKIEELKDEIVHSTCGLIQIPSVHSEHSMPGAPFGKDIAQALDYTLTLAKRLGFRTKNMDGYCGYIEFGEGEELVGIIGHLDVVPVDHTWSYEPFAATIADGKIYGRGAIDDKGPVIAALYAMKAVMDSCKVSKRVRLILGTNEERDWQCIHYYKSHEELPTIGFSPDADFPCIYAEKSVLSMYITQEYSATQTDAIIIENINCYQNAINVVPKQCDITLKIAEEISMEDILSKIKILITSHSYSIEVSQLENHKIMLKSLGVASHAAHPDLGRNAIAPLLLLLQEIYQEYNIHLSIFDFFATHIGDSYQGENLKINIQDESGILTLNTAQFKLENDKLMLGFNLRIPIHTPIDTVKDTIKNVADSTSLFIEFVGENPALYLPKDHVLVKTLCDIYNQSTDSNLEPVAIGGATYARAFPNCISFGANLPGHEDMCHQADEYIEIDNLMLASKIYAKAIYALAK